VKFDQFQHAGQTDVGVKRSHNQDAFAIQLAADADHFETTGHIFLVADGMGGHAVGEKASAQAIREIPHTYLKHAAEGPAPALRRSFLETNTSIFSVGQENPEFRGLGTTATALVLRADGAWVGHVGDSRVYRIRGDVLQQLSFDHSLVWALARQQGVDPDELSDVRKNVIIRSLGPDSLVQVDVEGPYPLEPNDVFILCSDGLSNPLQPDEIGSIAANLPPSEACKFLIELANLRGGPDNITSIIVRVTRDGDSSTIIPATTATRPNVFKRLLSRGLRSMPWPLLVLLMGFALAIGFIIFKVEEIPGGSALFVLAAISIGVGLIGLGIHSQREQPDDQEDDNPPTKANIYKQHACAIDQTAIDKFNKIDALLLQHLEKNDWPFEVKKHALHLSESRKLYTSGDASGGFREICRAIQILAACFNQHRHKEESFQPNWNTPPDEAG